MKPIAHVETPYPEKFGVPRQSLLAPSAQARLVFEAEYRSPECVRGIEGFSHVWLIWGFHANGTDTWHPTVRPPRLGGNERVGVFATRSPFRPNPLGLSAVELLGIDRQGSEAPVLLLGGVDLVDRTPVYDVKPYVPATDSIPGARGGFTEERERAVLDVTVEQGCTLPADCSDNWRQTLFETLRQDPRPAYQNDAERVYHLALHPYDISFRVSGGTAVILSFKAR